MDLIEIQIDIWFDLKKPHFYDGNSAKEYLWDQFNMCDFQHSVAEYFFNAILREYTRD